MEDVIDIRTALEQLGTAWQFGGSVTDGTQQAWDDVTWEDKRDKPSWEDIVASYSAIQANTQIASIEDFYAKKFAALDAALLTALWVDGDNVAATRQTLSTKRQQFVADRDAAILNVLLTTG